MAKMKRATSRRRYVALLLFEVRQRSGRRRSRFFELRCVGVRGIGEAMARRTLESYGRSDQWESVAGDVTMTQRFLGVLNIKDESIQTDARVEDAWYGYVDDIRGVVMRLGLPLPPLGGVATAHPKARRRTRRRRKPAAG